MLLAMGDQLLRQVVVSIRRLVRANDVVVRRGDNEFVCGLVDLIRAETAKRFEMVDTDPQRGNIRPSLLDLLNSVSASSCSLLRRSTSHADLFARPSSAA
jgi:GGDEF domain-containing protein